LLNVPVGLSRRAGQAPAARSQVKAMLEARPAESLICNIFVAQETLRPDAAVRRLVRLTMSIVSA
jgi:hypothetical protein